MAPRFLESSIQEFLPTKRLFVNDSLKKVEFENALFCSILIFLNLNSAVKGHDHDSTWILCPFQGTTPSYIPSLLIPRINTNEIRGINKFRLPCVKLPSVKNPFDFLARKFGTC